MAFDNLENKCTIDMVNTRYNKYIVQHIYFYNTYSYNKHEIHKINIT
jgi:hypothetical protein